MWCVTAAAITFSTSVSFVGSLLLCHSPADWNADIRCVKYTNCRIKGNKSIAFVFQLLHNDSNALNGTSFWSRWITKRNANAYHSRWYWWRYATGKPSHISRLSTSITIAVINVELDRLRLALRLRKFRSHPFRWENESPMWNMRLFDAN